MCFASHFLERAKHQNTDSKSASTYGRTCAATLASFSLVESVAWTTPQEGLRPSPLQVLLRLPTTLLLLYDDDGDEDNDDDDYDADYDYDD